ncbi:phage/plasmid primase, P4 family [Trichocoleus sp. FACHB-262]|uniref:phage/plasmid primase, P4 family n=1 Tax=Trichocoleus sp. FACHB-262 TaxID=2692869 RepID=UPI001685AED4|nr:phage/plasmid primase, P4 family [Trichocoleus sp. FACHB-262]MBD2124755.1 DUF3854 domain-containing protein [Trichocoleus sp. FACHB-262]
MPSLDDSCPHRASSSVVDSQTSPHTPAPLSVARQRLAEHHYQDLRSSGLSDSQIAQTGHRSVDKATAKQLVGIDQPGLLFLYRDIHGNLIKRSDGKPFLRLKPDYLGGRPEGAPKYLSPKNQGNRPYFSQLLENWPGVAKSPKHDLDETEGEKKADALCSHGIAAIGYSGVWGWLDKEPRLVEQVQEPAQLLEDPFDPTDLQHLYKLEESRPLPELQDLVWPNRRVNQAFDSDWRFNNAVKAALFHRARDLYRRGARPHLVDLPNEVDGAKNGVDDFIVRHGPEAYRVLRANARPSLVPKGKGQSRRLCLNIGEPTSHIKALMAWSVLKERWAYRPALGWYEWQGNRWQPQCKNCFEAELMQFMDAQGWQDYSNGQLNSLVRELTSRLIVKVWCPETKLAFSNGTLDLVSGEFTDKHEPLDRLTSVLPYAFDPHAHCSIWLAFLQEATGDDREVIKLLQAWLKYAILPVPQDRKSGIEKSLDLFGAKGTGKGTFLDILGALVGDENVGPASPETFKSAQGLAALVDKTLAIDHDSSGFLENVGVYNKVVSNEPVEVRKLYRDSTTIRLGVKVVRSYNQFLPVPDGSEGLDRRLTVVQFKNKPQHRDEDLSEKLRNELPGIFAWAWELNVEAMKRRILWSGSIESVARASIERFEANNPVFLFLCEKFPKGKAEIQAIELFTSWSDWARNRGHTVGSQNRLSAALKALNCQKSPKTNGVYFWNIPDMSQFDVSCHLGTLPTVVEDNLRDNLRDTSNPELESNRDTWGHLERQSNLEEEETRQQALADPPALENYSDLEVSPSVPKPDEKRKAGVLSDADGLRQSATSSSIDLAKRLLACRTSAEQSTLKSNTSIERLKQAYNRYLTPAQRSLIKTIHKHGTEPTLCSDFAEGEVVCLRYEPGKQGQIIRFCSTGRFEVQIGARTDFYRARELLKTSLNGQNG